MLRKESGVDSNWLFLIKRFEDFFFSSIQQCMFLLIFPTWTVNEKTHHFYSFAQSMAKPALLAEQ